MAKIKSLKKSILQRCWWEPIFEKLQSLDRDDNPETGNRFQCSLTICSMNCISSSVFERNLLYSWDTPLCNTSFLHLHCLPRYQNLYLGGITKKLQVFRHCRDMLPSMVTLTQNFYKIFRIYTQSWGFSVLFKGTVVGIEGGREHCTFTPPTYNPCWYWDSNPLPSGYKSDSLTLGHKLPFISDIRNSQHLSVNKNFTNISIKSWSTCW